MATAGKAGLARDENPRGQLGCFCDNPPTEQADLKRLLGPGGENETERRASKGRPNVSVPHADWFTVQGTVPY